ncbi:hypothetical protein CsSME_00032476 [Camellia sinensis var. sinensis]
MALHTLVGDIPPHMLHHMFHILNLKNQRLTLNELTKRNTRGITCMVEVWNLTPEERIMLTFNKDLQAVSIEGGIFSRFIGTIARKPHLCPIKYKNWYEVPD